MKLYFDQTKTNQPLSGINVRRLFWKMKLEAGSVSVVETYLRDTYNITFLFNTDFNGVSGLDIPDDQLTLLLLKYSL